jgi:hypothetical protein
MSEEIVEQPDMGISHGDFFRIFPRVVAPLAVERDGLRVKVDWTGGKHLQVVLSEEKVRKLALLRVSYLDLRFHFENFTPGERDRFLECFHRAFQKGGG